jgi:hypothetical protein
MEDITLPTALALTLAFGLTFAFFGESFFFLVGPTPIDGIG